MTVMTKIERLTDAPKNLKEMQKLYDDLMSEGEKIDKPYLYSKEDNYG